MATTTPDCIYSPDAGQQYALTQDLLLMADSVQDALTEARNEWESEWHAVPAFGDGTWSVVGSYGFRGLSVRRLGDLVRIEGTISRTAGTIADGYIGAIVPNGFRPPYRVWVPNGFSPLTATPRNLEVTVETDGSVRFGLFGQPDVPTDQVINLSGTWFV